MANPNANELRFPGNEIHYTAIIGENVTMGTGNYIGPYCLIGMPGEHKAGWRKSEGLVVIGNNNIITGFVTIDSPVELLTTNICNGCFIMKHSYVGHDCWIGNNVTISCGAKIGGHVQLCTNVNVGLNAVIHQRQFISQGVMIGMGAVVTAKLKIEPFQTYAGNPARHIGPNKKYNESSSTDVKL